MNNHKETVFAEMIEMAKQWPLDYLRAVIQTGYVIAATSKSRDGDIAEALTLLEDILRQRESEWVS